VEVVKKLNIIVNTVKACPVNVTPVKVINSGRLFRPTLSFFLGSVCNITVAAYVHSDAFSGACHRQKGATLRGSLNRASFNNYQSDDFSPRRPPIESPVTFWPFDRRKMT